jgi:hypothetical protein
LREEKDMLSLMPESPAKKRAHDLIAGLPDSATWGDILYAMELAADIDQAIDDANGGKTVDSTAVRRKLGLAV